MAQFAGGSGWGYGDSYYLCIESVTGGRDQYRHFIRECHRRGLAVIQDVVYNHYDPDAERAQWQYDSTAPEDIIYYWYQGRPSDYPNPDGGYLNNGSTGYTPRFWDEQVRQLLINSAAWLLEEMHVDGFLVDLTQAIHRDNTLNATGKSIPDANIFGQKFLRQWSGYTIYKDLLAIPKRWLERDLEQRCGSLWRDEPRQRRRDDSIY